MKWATQQVWKPAFRCLGGPGLLGLLLATATCAQDPQFFFDLSGNLFVQTAETNAPPQITGQPQSQIVALGEMASFSVVVADTLDVSYQWQFGGNAIAGATADTLLVTNVSAASEGQYSVVVGNGLGSMTSAPAMLWFDGNGNGLPDSWEMAHFGNLNQTALGDFDGDGVSNLDEFLEGTDPTDPHSYHPRLHLVSFGNGIAYTAPPLPYYNLGQVVTLTALPDPWTSFLGWTGSTPGIKPQISVLMNGHKNITALFGEQMPPPVFQSVSASGGSISLTWSTYPGRTYQLQFKSDLMETNWNNLGGPLTAAGLTITTTDPAAANTQRFYRVGILP